MAKQKYTKKINQTAFGFWLMRTYRNFKVNKTIKKNKDSNKIVIKTDVLFSNQRAFGKKIKKQTIYDT